MREVVFGRKGGDADVQYDDEYLSKRHCRVWQDPDGSTWVEDLGTTNGTRVNDRLGSPVYGPQRIRPGDVLHIGRTAVPWTP